MNKKSKYLFIGIATLMVLTVVTAFLINKARKINCDSRMLFVGDSHTAGSWSYADKIIANCKSKTSKKIAKEGAPTTWILEQLKNELQENKYDLVVILGGSNDIFGSLSIDKAKSNMNQMLNLIEDSGAKSVVINPPSKKFYSGTTDNHKELINQWTEFLKNHKRPFSFIDFESLTQDIEVFAGDMIHVNSYGHKRLADTFTNKMKLS